MQPVNENSRFLLPTDIDLYLDSTDGAWVNLDKNGDNLNLSDDEKRQRLFYSEAPPTGTTTFGYFETPKVHSLRLKGGLKKDDYIKIAEKLNEVDGNNFIFPVSSLTYNEDTTTKEFLNTITKTGIEQAIDVSVTDEKIKETIKSKSTDWDKYIKIKMVPYSTVSLPQWAYLGPEGTTYEFEKLTYSEVVDNNKYIVSKFASDGTERKLDSDEKITFYYCEDSKWHEISAKTGESVYILRENVSKDVSQTDLKASQEIKQFVLDEMSKTSDIIIITSDKINEKATQNSLHFYNTSKWNFASNKIEADEITDLLSTKDGEYYIVDLTSRGVTYGGNVSGIVYIKDENGQTWVNLNKKVIAKFHDYFKTKGNNITSGIKDALFSPIFYPYTYNYEHFRYADEVEGDISGLDDRPQIQQELYGQSFDFMKQYRLTIGDCTFCIPPVAINVITQTTSERMPLLRARGSVAKSNRKLQKLINVSMYFSDDSGINGVPKDFTHKSGQQTTYYMNGLRALLSQFMFTPFVPIENEYINRVLRIDAVTFDHISINTVDGYPRLVRVDLQLREFEYRIFMPEIPITLNYKYSLDEGTIEETKTWTNPFANVINWPVFRYYYQRCLQLGNRLKDFPVNSDTYSEAIFGKKALVPANFNDCSMKIFIPNEEELQKKLQIKLEAMRYPHGYKETLSDEEMSLSKELAQVYPAIVDVATSDEFKKALTELNSYIKEDINLTTSDILNDESTKIELIPINTNIKKCLEIIAKKINSMVSVDNNSQKVFSSYDFKTKEVEDEDDGLFVVAGIEATVNQKIIDINTDIDTLKKEASQSIGENTTLFFNNKTIFVGIKIKLKDEIGDDVIPTNESFIFDSASSEMKFLQFCGTVTDDNITNPAVTGRKNIEEQFYDNIKFDSYQLDDLIIDSFSASMGNNFADISLSSYTGYATQYTGGQDVGINVNFVTTNKTTAARLHALTEISTGMAKEYRLILPIFPLKIDSQISRLLGIDEVSIEHCQVSTVQGYPGLYRISISFLSMNRTLRNKEIMKKKELDNFTETRPNQIMEAQRDSFFEINNWLSDAELYPDLELPTLKELEETGYPLMRHKMQNRTYPDPDFYFVYPYQKTSEIIRETVRSFTKQKGLGLTLTNSYGEFIDVPEANSSDMEKIAKEKYKDQEELKKLQEDKLEKQAAEAKASLKNAPLYSVMKKLEYNPFTLESDLRNSWKISNKITGVFLEKSIWQSLSDNGQIAAANEEIEKISEELDKKISSLETEYNETNASDIKKQIEDVKTAKEEFLAIKKKNEKTLSIGKRTNYDTNQRIFKYKTKMISQINKILGESIDANLGYDSYLDNYQSSEKNEIDERLKLAKTAYEATLSNEAEESVKKVEAEKIDFVNNGTISIFNVVTYLDKITDVTDIAAGIADDIINTELKIDKETLTRYKNSKMFDLVSELFDGIGSKDIVNFLVALAAARSGNQDYHEKNADWLGNSLLKKELLKANKTTQPIYVSSFRPNNFGIFKMQTYDKQAYINNKINHFLQDYEYKKGTDEYLGAKIDTVQSMSRNSFVLDDYYATKASNEELTLYYLSCILHPGYAMMAFLRNILFYFRELILEEVIPSYAYDILAEEVKIAGQANDSLRRVYGEGVTTETIAAYESFIEKQQEAIKLGKFFIATSFAVTDGSNTLKEYFKGRKYNELNAITQSAKTTIVKNQVNKELSFSEMICKFIHALCGTEVIKDGIGVGERGADLPGQVAINDELKDMYDKAMRDPNRYLRDSFYDMVINDKRGRMARAFPTFYMLFIDEGRLIGKWKLHDNFYNTSAITEIQVAKSRKNPTDVATITMSNFFKTYTSDDEDLNINFTTNWDDVWDSMWLPNLKRYAIRQDEKLKNTADPLKMKIRPGARVQIRMGYSGNAAELPTQFNGYISEVSCGEYVQLIAQSDGAEISNPILEEEYADELETIDEWTKNTFEFSQTPKTIIAKLLTTRGGAINNWLYEHQDDYQTLYYFGDKIGTSYNRFGLVHFGQRGFTEIFKTGEICQNIFEGPAYNERQSFFKDTDDDTVPELSFTLYGKTIWECLHICRSACPDYITAIAPFGFRSTIFFGKPHYYYAYDYYQNEDFLMEKRKPYQQYHIYNSFTDIIANNIEVSSEKVRTCAIGLYQVDGFMQDSITKKTDPIFVDREIYPEFQKTMIYDTKLYGRSVTSGRVGVLGAVGVGGTSGATLGFMLGGPIGAVVGGVAGGIIAPAVTPLINQFDEYIPERMADTHATNAVTMTVTGLRDSLKEMYQGELIVIGDPTVKPFDRVILNDDEELMEGQVEVREVVQNFSGYNGYTTSVYVDCISAINKQEEIQKTWMSSVALHTASLGIGGAIFTKSIASGIKEKITKHMGDPTKDLDVLQRADKVKRNTFVYIANEIKNKIGDKIPGPAIKAAKFIGGPVQFLASAGFFFLGDYLSKQLKYSKCCAVFPLIKNKKVFTAGLDGSQGLIVGSPTEHNEGLMRTLLSEFVTNPIADFIFGFEERGAYDYAQSILNNNMYDNLNDEEKIRFEMLRAMRDSDLETYGQIGHLSPFIPRIDPRYSKEKEVDAVFSPIMIKGNDINTEDNNIARRGLVVIENYKLLEQYRKSGFFKIFTKDVNNPECTIEPIKIKIGDVEYTAQKLILRKNDDKKGFAYSYSVLSQDALSVLYRIVNDTYKKAIADNEQLDMIYYHDNYASSYIVLQNALILEANDDTVLNGNKANTKYIKKACRRSGYSFAFSVTDKCIDVIDDVMKKIKKDLSYEYKNVNFEVFDSKEITSQKADSKQKNYRIWVFPKVK